MMKNILCILLGLFCTSFAYAQEVGIVAVVDNDIISSADVENRIHLINLSQQQAGQPGAGNAIRPQVIEMLIAERLYRKEAKRLKFSVSEEEFAHATSVVEERNHLQNGGMKALLERNHIPFVTFKDQLTAQLLWNKVIASQIQPKIKVSDIEVKNAKSTIKAIERPKIREVLISEIALPIKSAAEDRATKTLAEKLAKEIRAGKSFAAVASEYSKSPTASGGGTVGWVVEQALPPELAQTISGLQEGQVSNALRSTRGYYIIKLSGRRNALSKEQYGTRLQLKQIFKPLAFDASKATIQQEEQGLQNLAKRISSCKDFDTVVADAMPSESLDAIDVTIKDIHPDLQNHLLTQPVNGGASVLHSTSGLHMIVVCKRNNVAAVEEKPVVLDDEAVRNLLLQKKIEGQAQHYLGNLRRKAEIEIR